MAARLKKMHSDEVRLKIKTSQLVNRLNDYALGKLDDDDISPNRIRAIDILLRKALPDLSSIQLTGDEANPVAFTQIARKIIDAENSDD